METEIISTISLIPSDGIRPGDTWEVKNSLKIPVLRASDIAPRIEFPVKVTYVNNEAVNNINCRYFRSAGSLWLKDADISIADILPDEEIKRIGGSHYKYFKDRGGKLLYKKEQWLDKATGYVVKSRIQTRIIAWIQDLENPVGKNNAEIDTDMIVSLAHVINASLTN